MHRGEVGLGTFGGKGRVARHFLLKSGSAGDRVGGFGGRSEVRACLSACLLVSGRPGMSRIAMLRSEFV